MNTTLKKILIIVIVVLVIALIGLLVYNFIIKPKTITPENNGNELPSGNTNNNNGTNNEGNNEGNENNEGEYQQAELKIKAISSETVLSPTINNDKTKIIYFLRSNGNIIESDFFGTTKTIFSDANLENLKLVIWAPNKNKAITIFQDNMENINRYLYNLSDRKSFPLSKYLSYISWSAESNKIAYQFQNENTDTNDISIANPDGTKYSVILNTRMKNLIVEWPSTNIYLREKPSGLTQSTLYSLSPTSRALNKIISDIYGLSIKWSLKGDKLLYSKTNSKGQDIEILTASSNGTSQKSTKISTLAEKCTWSQDVRYIFCAIPKNIKEATVLPDDFYKGTFIGNDEFYKINISTGEKVNLLDGENLNANYDANDLFLSPQEDYLFFVNKGDGLLYAIKL